MKFVELMLLFTLPLVKLELPLLEKLKKKSEPPKRDCGQYSQQLASLFQLMCNNLRSENDDTKNGCVGCFRQAAFAINNQPSLFDLDNCVAKYLPETEYDLCINLIETNTPTPAPGECVTGYCKFVTCVRRINADMLISDCIYEALVGNDDVLLEERIQLFKNTTSCVLAKTRCSSFNPITGQPQTNTITRTSFTKWGKPKIKTIELYNTLQITPDGDLRIIQFPGTTKIQAYFCNSQPNLRESGWLEYSC